MSYCIATVNIRKIIKSGRFSFVFGRHENAGLVLGAFCVGNLWFSGNLIADGMVHQNLRHPDDTHWNDVAIAILNGGAIRASLDRGK